MRRTSDKRLREILIRALIVEPDRDKAGEILERWDELVELEAGVRDGLKERGEIRPELLERLRR